jgi:hypothetical protein
MLNTTLRGQFDQLLSSISQDSSFVTKGSVDFTLPGLEIKGLGTIPFPLTALTAQAMIKLGQQAPYGKGSQTIVDTKVRHTWELDPSQFQFKGKAWEIILKQIVLRVQQDMNLGGRQVVAELYKLLLYEPGSFFRKHKDSEKTAGMFGTLVITLPSEYTGGEFVIEFDGKKERIDFKHLSDQYNWMAFYADCDHEILPIRSGYRLCVVYNLISSGKSELPAPFSVSLAKSAAMNFFQNPAWNQLDRPLALLLKHQYTPENFSLEQLKGGDKECVSILMEVADQLGWYFNLGLLNHEVLGVPEMDYYDDPDDDFTNMEEVIDESSFIDHWCMQPSPGNIDMNQIDIINEVDYEKAEPFEKQSEGYMGNYGPELSFFYHYGFVLLAPATAFSNLMKGFGINEKISWIAHYLQGRNKQPEQAIALYDSIDWSEQLMSNTKTDGLLMLWTLQPQCFLKDGQRDAKFLRVFTQASKQQVAAFFYQQQPERLNALITLCMQATSEKSIATCASVVAYMFTSKKYNTYCITHHLEKALIDQLLPVMTTVSTRDPWYGRNYRIDFLKSLLAISGVQSLQPEQIIHPLSTLIDRRDVYMVYLPVIRDTDPSLLLTQRMKKMVVDYLKQTTTTAPEPHFPQLKKTDEVDLLLYDFCHQPDANRMEYKAAAPKREKLIHRIEQYQLDIDHTLVRKGSPQSLVLKKNQHTYQRKVTEYKEDLATLARLK